MILRKLPFIIAVLGMAGGVLIGILFGANEDFFQNRISAGLARNHDIQSISDNSEREAKIKTESAKLWRCYQRYHFHANGIAGLSLAILTLMSFIQAPHLLRFCVQYSVAVGGFLYPFVWLLIAIYGPEIGRTEAHDTFAIFGYMGGVFFVGILGFIFAALKYPWNLEIRSQKNSTFR